MDAGARPSWSSDANAEPLTVSSLRAAIDEVQPGETINVEIVLPNGLVQNGFLTSARTQVVGEEYPTNTLLLRVATR